MSSPASSAKSRRIRGFDGLRALAAWLVFCEHKVTRYTVGAIGVWIFFTLSGYLICGILSQAAERAQAASGRPWSELAGFWRNRALRIWPVYYITLFGLFAATRLVNAQELLAYSLYLQNFYIGFVTHAWSPITHFWSLAVEQQFYILLAPLLLWLEPAKHQIVLFGMLGLSLLCVALGEALAWDPMLISLLPSTNFGFMAVGGLLKLGGFPGSLRRQLGRSGTLAWAGVAFVSTFFLFTHPEDSTSGTPWPVFLCGLFLSGSLVAFVVANPDSRVVAWLELPPLRWFGTISYGFYVYHALVPEQWRVLGALGLSGTMLPWPVWSGLQFLVALVVAQFSWTFIEKPFLRLKRPS
jgi:peptidoglycan/LPS O-acetylase OafA/YrhL